SSIRFSSAAVIGVPPASPFFHLSGSNAISSHLRGRDRLRERCFHPEPPSRGFGVDDLRHRVKVGEAPAVHNLSAERDLVVTLQVPAAIRVAIPDHLQANGPLDTPADGPEVTNEALHVGSSGSHAHGT